MKRIDELLEKYFAGITSMQEEKELKNYFNSQGIEKEHEKYLPLFQAFEKEKEIVLPTREIKIAKKTSPPRRIMILASSVAAACLLLMLVYRHQTTNQNYMIVHGKRINDSEMAREYANAKVEKSLNVIQKSLESYKGNAEVQQKLKEIENQIKIK